MINILDLDDEGGILLNGKGSKDGVEKSGSRHTTDSKEAKATSNIED